MPIPDKIIPGTVYGMLTVIRELPLDKLASGETKRRFLFKCECGVEKSIRLSGVKNGYQKSCGCYLKNNPKIKHGQTHSLTYSSWCCMKARCYIPSIKLYHRYGGRGIKVCGRWKHSFETFRDDMGERPSKAFSLERIDPNGDYSKENCRWATRLEQGRNKVNTIHIEHEGKRQALTQWAVELGFSYFSAYNQVIRLGTPFETFLEKHRNKTKS